MKRVIDMNGPAHTTAWALIKGGDLLAGRLVANWSNNPNGAVCSVLLQIYGDQFVSGTGKAGGYGYCKLSAALYDALINMGFTPQIVKPGNGLHREELENMGFTVITVL